MSNTRRKTRLNKLLSTLAVSTAITCSAGGAIAGEWRVGGNLFVGTNPYVGGDGVVGLLPVVAYKSGRFHANLGDPGISFYRGSTDIGGIGYSVIDNESFQLDLVGRLRAIGLDPDEEQEWNGLDERKPGFDAGVSMLWETGFGELNIDLLTDASNKSKGQEAVFAYAYPISQGRWTLRPEIGVSWQSSDLVDYYFGVDAHESRVGRAAYEADATLTPFAGVQFEYALYERTQLLGGVGVARLGDGINDSPIVDDRGVGVGYLGLSYSL